MTLRWIRRRALPFAVASLLASSIVTASVTHAAGNVLYLTPTPSQLNINGTVTVNVRGYVESSGSTGRAQGTVTYPQNLLRVNSISTAGSAYNNPTVTQNAGALGFSAVQTPGPTGQVQIFSITFQAIAAGTAVVGFSGDSTINQSATNRNTATYTVNPNPTPPPTPTPAPTPTPTPAPTPTPIPTEEIPEEEETEEDTTGLINNVSVLSDYTTSTVSWKLSSEGGTTELGYGTSSDNLSNKPPVTRKEDGTYSATLTNLAPGNRYYFRISGTSASKKPGTYTGVIMTRGFPVKLMITENGAPSATAKLRIGQQTYATSKDGSIQLSLAQGKYTATITTDTSSKYIEFSVAAKDIPTDGNAPAQQSFSFDVPVQAKEEGSPFGIFAFIGALIIGLFILGIGFFAFLAIRRKRLEAEGGGIGGSSGTAVIIDDGYDWRHSATDTTQNDAASPYATPPVSTSEIDFQPSMPVQPPSVEPLVPQSTHDNSVYLAEEEPKDMFELAKEQSQLAPIAPPSGVTLQGVSPAQSTLSKPLSDGSPQNPNPPHSTTP